MWEMTRRVAMIFAIRRDSRSGILRAVVLDLAGRFAAMSFGLKRDILRLHISTESTGLHSLDIGCLISKTKPLSSLPSRSVRRPSSVLFDFHPEQRPFASV